MLGVGGQAAREKEVHVARKRALCVRSLSAEPVNSVKKNCSTAEPKRTKTALLEASCDECRIDISPIRCRVKKKGKLNYNSTAS